MKYALIGCGRIAVNHIKAALNNKLEVVAVCDILQNKMENLLAKQGLEKDTSICAIQITEKCWQNIQRLSSLVLQLKAEAMQRLHYTVLSIR